MAQRDLDALAITEAEARAAVGPRADFYLAKWQESSSGGYNWAAFFLSGLWLPYRKLYVPAAILLLAVVAETVLEEAVLVYTLGMPAVPRWLERLVALVVSVVCGRYGNRWYLHRVASLVEGARAVTPDPEQRLAYLRRRGGTSVAAAIIFLVVFAVVLVLALIGVEFALGTGEGPTYSQGGLTTR